MVSAEVVLITENPTKPDIRAVNAEPTFKLKEKAKSARQNQELEMEFEQTGTIKKSDFGKDDRTSTAKTI